MKKLFILFIALVGFGVSSYGQNNATATSSATIVTPIKITHVANLNFGNLTVGTTGGDITLTPAGTLTGETGTVKAPKSGEGSVTAAEFTVEGQANYVYTISVLPASVTLKDVNGTGTHTMTLTNWATTPTPTGQLDASAGSQTLKVGGTLTLSGSQAAGSYKGTEDISVTVNYQ